MLAPVDIVNVEAGPSHMEIGGIEQHFRYYFSLSVNATIGS